MKTPSLVLLASLTFTAALTAQAAPPIGPPGGPMGRRAFGPSAQPPTLPPITSVSIDSHGQFVVNNKPFFPILIYDAPTDPMALAKLHDAGFNVVTASKPEDAVNLPAHGFYAAYTPSEKPVNLSGVLLGMGVDSPAENFATDMVAKTKEANAKVAAKLPGRPLISAIGYWGHEPAGVKANEVLGKDKYEGVVEAIDVAGPYLYPVPYQPVSSVADAVARAKAVGGGSKAVVPILQIFVWDVKDRYPTPDELRCMVFESLIEGANGIGYYSYGSVTGHPKETIAAVNPRLWASVKAINTDLAHAAAMLANSTPTQVELGEKDPAIKMRGATTAGGKTVVILANTSDAPNTVVLKGVDHLMSRDPAVGVSEAGGDTTVKLGAFGTAVLAAPMEPR